MKKLLVSLSLLLFPLSALAQQIDPPDGAAISSAQVSGLDLGRLSPGLQAEIAKLEGAALNRARLDEIAARIEAEQPRFIAAVRIFRAPADEVRVVFVVAHRSDQDRKANINSSYLVEQAEIRGIDEADLSSELRAALPALVGKPLGSDEVEQFETKLREALPDHTVRRRALRGSRSGEVRLLFIVDKMESARWLHFEPLRSNALYHSDQGWGALMDLPISGRDFRVVPIVALDNHEDLIEEDSGFGIRVESRKLGTERLGASFEWSSFDQDWSAGTLAAIDVNPRIPAAYGQRSTVTPMLTFALTPQWRVSGGVGITELEPLSGIPESQMANVAIAAVGFDDEWSAAGARHDLAAVFTVRTATEGLESDFEYTRSFGEAAYRYRRDRHTVLASGMGGGISGSAPMFERFSIGDSRTLRGWNKYEIAPAGGDRVFYGSVEYRYRGWAFFLDAGSVWDAGSDARTRVAAGFGYHPGPFFMTLGFPLNTDDVRAVFTTGVRFGGVGYRKD